MNSDTASALTDLVTIRIAWWEHRKPVPGMLQGYNGQQYGGQWAGMWTNTLLAHRQTGTTRDSWAGGRDGPKPMTVHICGKLMETEFWLNPTSNRCNDQCTVLGKGFSRSTISSYFAQYVTQELKQFCKEKWAKIPLQLCKRLIPIRVHMIPEPIHHVTPQSTTYRAY